MSGSIDHRVEQRYSPRDTTDDTTVGRQSAKPPPLRALRRGLKGLRNSENFRLWARFVLAPEDAELLKQWALADEATYGLLVRRYGECRDESDREDLLNRLQQSLERFAQVIVQARYAGTDVPPAKTDEPA